MRTCNEYEELISCMIDGELDSSTQAELHAHIETCENCKLIYQAFSGISECMKDDMAEVPENLVPSVMDKAAPQQISILQRYKWMRVVGAAACTALVIIGAGSLYLFSGGTSTNSLSPTQNESAVMAEAPDSRDFSEPETDNVQATNQFEYGQGNPPDTLGPATNTDIYSSYGDTQPSPTTTPASATDTLLENYYMEDGVAGSKSDIHSKAFIPSFATLELMEDSLTAYGASFSLTNLTDETLTYGEVFSIHVWNDSEWQEIDLNATWLLPAYILDAGETVVLEIDWSDFCGALDSGIYSVGKIVTDPNSTDHVIKSEFEIK